MTRLGVPPAAEIGTIRWGSGAHTFELRTDDAPALARAHAVFRPWRTDDAAIPTLRAWSLARNAGGLPDWTLQPDDGGDALAFSGDAGAAVRRAEFLGVQAIFDGPPDVLTLHAALVARAGRGLLIAGLPEVGKSTIACALWQRGFSLLGDDVAIVDPDTGRAAPAPRRVSLRTPSRALLGDDLWSRIHEAPATDVTPEGCLFQPCEIAGDRPPAVTVAAIVFLARTGARPCSATVRRIPAAHAALALLPFSNLIRRLDAGMLIARLAPFAARTPAWDARRAPLAEMAPALEALLDRPTP
jgi:hypothetical protein